MLQRGDLATLHEPFIYLYYLGDAHKPLDYFDPDPAHPTDYAGIRDMILQRAQHDPVFVKDMCYYITDYFGNDRELLEAATHTYLIRTPERSVPSYHRLDPHLTSDEIGLDSLYRHFETVANHTGRTPVVIDAADLTSDPMGTVRAYCEAIGLPFLEHSLSWDNDAVPKEWMHVAGWHTDLAASSGMGTVKRSSASLDDAPYLRELCDQHLPYYEKLREHRLQPITR